eukprot:366516-Chlamydomonas_euryale.AAC.8
MLGFASPPHTHRNACIHTCKADAPHTQKCMYPHLQGRCPTHTETHVSTPARPMLLELSHPAPACSHTQVPECRATPTGAASLHPHSLAASSLHTPAPTPHALPHLQVGDTFVLNALGEDDFSATMRHFLQRFTAGQDRFEASVGESVARVRAGVANATDSTRNETTLPAAYHCQAGQASHTALSMLCLPPPTPQLCGVEIFWHTQFV